MWVSPDVGQPQGSLVLAAKAVTTREFFFILGIIESHIYFCSSINKVNKDKIKCTLMFSIHKFDA